MFKISSVFRRLLLSSLLLANLAAGAELDRPRIGLVLGGGGARGAAHIGVLEVLEKLHIPVDCVAGTSMGALVAGAYAAGMAPAVMRKALGAADWNDMFNDNPDYSEMSYRNKVTLRRYLPGLETGVSADGAKYQPGVVTGQKIKLFFNQLVRANQGERYIENLPLPLSIVATDIGTGERVVFRDGSLTSAMRASMSVPGLLAPVNYQGRKLVDGGLVDNVPIQEVKDRCQADVVIAVNVGSPLLKAEEVGSLLTVSAQMVNILTEQNVTRSLALLGNGDILIQPDLVGISASDFPRHAETADRGRVAAEALTTRLQQLSQPRENYLAWWEGIEVTSRVSPRIDAIEVVGLAKVNPAMVERYLQVKQNDKVRPSEINRNLLRMYGDGYYENIDYQVLSQRERNILRVLPIEKSWGPDYLRFALNLESNSTQGATFGLRMAYHKTWLNSLGGELITNVDLGNNNGIGVSFYQPIDPAQRFFVDANVGIGETHTRLFVDEKQVAEYRDAQGAMGASVGANVGLLGQVRLGWIERKRSYSLEIGDPSLPDGDLKYGGYRATLDFDQLNALYFPSAGWSAKLGYFDSAGADYSRLDAEVRGVFSIEDTVFNASASFSGSPRGHLPIYDAAAMGGFLNLTAFAKNQIIGDNIAYVGVRGEQIIGRLPLGLRGDMRVGVAVEVAQVGNRFLSTGRNQVYDSLAFYLGGETPFGPTYVGAGYSSSGVANLFLFVGVP
ncbi:MAG: patatin-like phospholipase family protein [Rhodocyclaceae bacterium]|nr:patatin-like phospholipase family protein [Rhodocyclaceae bacterium]